MTRFILLLIILAITTTVPAQDAIDTIVREIEKNNTTLKSAREAMEAQKMANQTGIYLPGPEVEFGYLWGHPTEIGKRVDFSVTQTVDIATLSGAKRNVATERNVLAEWRYKVERMNILLEAKQYSIELIYYNALEEELERRLEHAEIIASGYEGRLKAGDVSQLDYNKARLNLSLAQGEKERVTMERLALLDQLKRLNGGIPLTLDQIEFEPLILPSDFHAWYRLVEEQHPALAYVRQQVALEKRNLTLRKTLNLPSLTTGYLSEKVMGEHFQGFTVGLSIPLWENKNQIHHARASIRAAEARFAEGTQQFYDSLLLRFNEANRFQVVAQYYRESMDKTNSGDLLKKALDGGQISLLEYVLEMELYYDIIQKALQAQKEFQLAHAALHAFAL